MRILVFNAGSSSLKFGLFDEDSQIFKGSFDRFRESGCDYGRSPCRCAGRAGRPGACQGLMLWVTALRMAGPISPVRQ